MVARLSPAIIAAAAALAGLLAAGPRSAAGAALVCGGALVAAAGIALAAFGRAPARATAAAGFGCAAAGLLSLSLALEVGRTHTGLAPQAVGRITAVAVEDSRPAAGGLSTVLVRLERVADRSGAMSAPARGEARLALRPGERLTAGQRISARGSLRASEDPLVPFFFEPSDLQVTGTVSAVARARASARAAVERTADGIGYPASALLLALFLGDRYGIPAEMEEAFAATGTLHLLALSGMHVGAIYLLAGTLLRPMLRPRPRWGVVAVLAAAYLWLAGPAPSLLRATLGFFAAGTARLFDRDHRPGNLLALVLLVHVALDPRDTFSLGFQLSYLAVAGLIAGDALLRRSLERWVPPVAAAAVAATAGAQVATLPLSLAAFGAWYPIGFVATLAGGPLVLLFLCMGLTALPLLGLPPVAAAAPWVLGLFYDVLLGGFRVLSRAPALTLAASAGAGALAVVTVLRPPRGPR